MLHLLQCYLNSFARSRDLQFFPYFSVELVSELGALLGSFDSPTQLPLGSHSWGLELLLSLQGNNDVLEIWICSLGSLDILTLELGASSFELVEGSIRC